MSEAPVTINDDDGLVDHFCYLDDILSRERGAGGAVTIRSAAAWKKWREISSFLTNRHITLSSRGSIYNDCIRSVLLYGSDTWGMTKKFNLRR